MKSSRGGEKVVDARRESRNRMIRRARIAFGGICLEGVMLDLSASGARVHLRHAEAVPECVQLHLPDGASIPARRRWRKDDQIGFAFLAPLPHGAESIGHG